MIDSTGQFWDAQAPCFDDEPDHGLRDAGVRAAWRDLLTSLLPPGPADVADLGCGTGSLSLLLAEEGYSVRGMDISPRMVEVARAKAAADGIAAEFEVGDAADPALQPATCDVVLARHVLWMFDDPSAVLAHWLRLLRPPGTLVLIEGLWSTGVGISARRCRELVLAHRQQADVTQLGDQDALWGRPVADERYAVVSPG